MNKLGKYCFMPSNSAPELPSSHRDIPLAATRLKMGLKNPEIEGTSFTDGPYACVVMVSPAKDTTAPRLMIRQINAALADEAVIAFAQFFPYLKNTAFLV